MEAKRKRITGEGLEQLLKVIHHVDENYSERRGHYFRIRVHTPEGKKTYGGDYNILPGEFNYNNFTDDQIERLLPLEREDDSEEETPTLKKLFGNNKWEIINVGFDDAPAWYKQSGGK